jgi:hypothetical protein
MTDAAQLFEEKDFHNRYVITDGKIILYYAVFRPVSGVNEIFDGGDILLFAEWRCGVRGRR